jgi:hypothetical protein
VVPTALGTANEEPVKVNVTPGADTGDGRRDTTLPFNVNSEYEHPVGKVFVKLTVRLWTRMGWLSGLEKVRGRFDGVVVSG